jgi:hypothetical protein
MGISFPALAGGAAAFTALALPAAAIFKFAHDTDTGGKHMHENRVGTSAFSGIVGGIVTGVGVALVKDSRSGGGLALSGAVAGAGLATLAMAASSMIDVSLDVLQH